MSGRSDWTGRMISPPDSVVGPTSRPEHELPGSSPETDPVQDLCPGSGNRCPIPYPSDTRGSPVLSPTSVVRSLNNRPSSPVRSFRPLPLHLYPGVGTLGWFQVSPVGRRWSSTSGVLGLTRRRTCTPVTVTNSREGDDERRTLLFFGDPRVWEGVGED